MVEKFNSKVVEKKWQSKWSEAKSIIKNWNAVQVKKKQKECKSWWSNYKDKLQTLIKNRVNI